MVVYSYFLNTYALTLESVSSSLCNSDVFGAEKGIVNILTLLLFLNIGWE